MGCLMSGSGGNPPGVIPQRCLRTGYRSVTALHSAAFSGSSSALQHSPVPVDDFVPFLYWQPYGDSFIEGESLQPLSALVQKCLSLEPGFFSRRPSCGHAADDTAQSAPTTSAAHRLIDPNCQTPVQHASNRSATQRHAPCLSAPGLESSEQSCLRQQLQTVQPLDSSVESGSPRDNRHQSLLRSQQSNAPPSTIDREPAIRALHRSSDGAPPRRFRFARVLNCLAPESSLPVQKCHSPDLRPDGQPVAAALQGRVAILVTCCDCKAPPYALSAQSLAGEPISRILSCAVIPLGAALLRTLISDLPGGCGNSWNRLSRIGPTRRAS